MRLLIKLEKEILYNMTQKRITRKQEEYRKQGKGMRLLIRQKKERLYNLTQNKRERRKRGTFREKLAR